jgi:hypothetical protein
MGYPCFLGNQETRICSPAGNITEFAPFSVKKKKVGTKREQLLDFYAFFR